MFGPIKPVYCKIVKDLWGDITGSTQRKAAGASADILESSGREAIAGLRQDLAPITATLQQSLPALMDFIMNPQAQADFASSNPLLQTLQQQAQAPIIANQAAKGKLGSGETLLALQNALLPVGLGLAQQRTQDLFNLAQFGAQGPLSLAPAVAGITTDIGSARAGAEVAKGRPSPLSQGLLSAGTMALGSFLCDAKTKENIELIGRLEDGIHVWKYNYVGDDKEDFQIGVMAQEVEEKYPDAVTEIDGIKRVDYGKLGLTEDVLNGARH